MMPSRMQRVAALLWVLALAGGSSAQAQQRPPQRPARGEFQREAQNRLIKRFLDHATSELNLSVEQRGQLDRVMQEVTDRRGDLARRQVRLRREIADALSNPATGDDEFRRLGDAELALKRDGMELLSWQHQRLSEVLTPRQTLRFLLMQERLAQRIEAMRRERRR